ncbi:hypothetical protein JTE90_011989 [Oedothorax gibbosus]|uniref:Uncharacterized protein n=1 Tax=Oedothorax gibbosus TaxID=931172 RepID=A0AAV6TG84_9ARAC|nr:hypothetical protein JTE90_011989 [Oedothorax gibbosus]
MAIVRLSRAPNTFHGSHERLASDALRGLVHPTASSSPTQKVAHWHSHPVSSAFSHAGGLLTHKNRYGPSNRVSLWPSQVPGNSFTIFRCRFPNVCASNSDNFHKWNAAGLRCRPPATTERDPRCGRPPAALYCHFAAGLIPRPPLTRAHRGADHPISCNFSKQPTPGDRIRIEHSSYGPRTTYAATAPVKADFACRVSSPGRSLLKPHFPRPCDAGDSALGFSRFMPLPRESLLVSLPRSIYMA